MRIAVVAPSCTLKREAAQAVQAIVDERGDCELAIHPQCFLSAGHFAGPDQARLQALHEVMADPSVDAVWFARGGYGSNRIAEAALANLPDAASGKLYMGYSDAGFLLAGLHKAGLNVAWGPMPQDALRGDHGLADGTAAIQRALDWLVRRDPAALEPEVEQPAMAFNLTVLSNLLGTPLEPDFSGIDLLIEEVSEHLYAIDRSMFHLTSSPAIRKVARLRLGRVGDVLPNDVDFGSDEAAIVQDWCHRSGIAFGGRADIGHDARNKVVPFGSAKS
jgi:muramoyltetrapeptide carboxypeptidase